MRRGRLERRVGAYADAALGERDAARVRRLIERDPAAQAVLRRRQQLSAGIRAAWNDGPEAPSAERLMQAIRPELARIDSELNAQLHTRGAWGLPALREALRPLRLPVLAGTAAAFLVLMYAAIPTSGPGPTPSPSRTELTAQAPELAPSHPQTLSLAAANETIYDLESDQGPVMIFEGDAGATIIWVVDDADELSHDPSVRSSGGWA